MTRAVFLLMVPPSGLFDGHLTANAEKHKTDKDVTHLKFPTINLSIELMTT